MSPNSPRKYPEKSKSELKHSVLEFPLCDVTQGRDITRRVIVGDQESLGFSRVDRNRNQLLDLIDWTFTKLFAYYYYLIIISCVFSKTKPLTFKPIFLYFEFFGMLIYCAISCTFYFATFLTTESPRLV